MLSREELKQRILQQQKIRELSMANKPQAQPMPSTGQMIKNVSGSIVRNVQSVVAGNSLNVTDEEKNRRFDICKACEFFRPDSQRCSKCGCYMSLKTYLKAEKCPVGRW